MSLKLKLANLDGLPPDIAKEYKPNTEGTGFILDTDVVFEDVTGLKSALSQEKKARKEATEKNATLETQVADLNARAGNPGDLEKSWEKKVEKLTNEAKLKQESLTGQIRTLLVDNVAQALAAEVSVSPDLIFPHIQKRLTVEEVDGKMITRVLDGEGKASALSVNELKSEVIADKRFAPIIVGSKASGGGAQGSDQRVPAGGKALKDMSESELTTLYKTNRPEFDRLSAAAKK